MALKGAIICIANNAALSTNPIVSSVQYAERKSMAYAKRCSKTAAKGTKSNNIGM